jgi:hypothetical protein
MVENGGAPVAGDIYYGVSTRLFVFCTIPPDGLVPGDTPGVIEKYPAAMQRVLPPVLLYRIPARMPAPIMASESAVSISPDVEVISCCYFWSRIFFYQDPDWKDLPGTIRDLKHLFVGIQLFFCIRKKVTCGVSAILGLPFSQTFGKGDIAAFFRGRLLAGSILLDGIPIRDEIYPGIIF